MACASLSALISLDTAPFASRGDYSAVTVLLADDTNSSKRPLVVARFFGRCTSQSESPVSWVPTSLTALAPPLVPMAGIPSPPMCAHGPRLAAAERS